MIDYDLQELLVHLTERSHLSRNGHIPELWHIDISHAMGKLAAKDNRAALFLRAKYTYPHNETNFHGMYGKLIRELDIQMWLAVLEMFLEKGWKRPESGKKWYMRSFGQLALAENLWPNQCLKCGGTAIEIVNNKLDDCSQCGGSGKGYMDDDARAEILGIRDFRKWSRRYTDIQSIPRMWEESGCNELRKILNIVKKA